MGISFRTAMVGAGVVGTATGIHSGIGAQRTSDTPREPASQTTSNTVEHPAMRAFLGALAGSIPGVVAGATLNHSGMKLAEFGGKGAAIGALFVAANGAVASLAQD